MATDNRAIGLFDSGIGGLTVLRALMNAFPNESFVYLGDTARLPYGSKSPETIRRYLVQNVKYLKDLDVKAIVVACNSASTALLGPQSAADPELRFDVPVYNVIDPGAETALRASRTKRIGVLGTQATVRGQAYVGAILERDRQAAIVQQACPLLVPLVEEGWEEDPITNLIVYRYISPLLAHDIDTLILGCTHYPALRGAIGRVVGPSIELVDSAMAIVSVLQADLAAGKIGASASGKPDERELKLLTTDVSPSFSEVAARLMRPHAIPPLQAVDIGTS